MNLHVCSDIHLDTWYLVYKEDYILDLFEHTKGDILILAGDLGEYINFKENYFIKFFDTISKNYNHVILLAGNHEFYNSQLYYNLLDDFYDSYSNFTFLEKQSIVIDDQQFIGTTLWSDLSFVKNNIKEKLAANINDYHLIRRYTNNKKITHEDTQIEFFHNKIYLLQNIVEGSVVITHHAPSTQSISPHYKTNVLNPWFASNCETVIALTSPRLWIHGHTHDKLDYNIGETRIVCNPCGYPNEYNGFSIKQIII